MVLFIDTDPGTDDMMALIYLLKYLGQEVVGMGSTSGNLDIEVTTRNVRLIAGCFKKDNNLQIEVFKGVPKQIVHLSTVDASSYHGSDGLGNFYSSDYYNNHKEDIDQLIDDVKISNKPSMMGLIELSKKYNGELTIIALGPLTNVALAQIVDPEFGSRIKEIFIMGGDLYGHGNSDDNVAAEFNFNHDPEAAYVVLKEMNCKKTILPLETNFPVGISKAIAQVWIEKLTGRHDLLSNLISSTLIFHHITYPSVELYDLMLAMVVMDPDIVTEWLSVNVAVELEGRYTRGKLVIDYYNRSEIHSFRPFRLVNIMKTFNYDKILENLDKFFV